GLGSRAEIGADRFHLGDAGLRGGLRPNLNEGLANRANIGNRANFTHIGNTNINIASSRSYFTGWQHGHWDGNWSRPGGGGYWNGWAHGFARGYDRGFWRGGWGGCLRGGIGWVLGGPLDCPPPLRGVRAAG